MQTQPQAFRKKPVVVDAFHFDGSLASAHLILGWIYTNGGKGSIKDGYRNQGPDTLMIETLEGVMEALPNDFIIRGVNGEFYPCKPDIFEKTYEVV